MKQRCPSAVPWGATGVRPTGLLCYLFVCALGLPLLAQTPPRDAAADGRSIVASVHSSQTRLTRGILTSRKVHPLGRLDYRVLARMADRAAMVATGHTRIAEAWGDVVSGADRVSILYDAGQPPASLVLLDVLVDRLVRAGVRPGNIIIWADSERSLFSAGISLRGDAGKVRVLGADSTGYRDGVSRILLDDCDLMINVARLRPDPRFGMCGAVANLLACLPPEDRAAALQDATQLANAPAQPVVRVKAKLHILDACQPNYDFGPLDMPPYWDCGRLLFSRDPVALDCAGAAILEAKRQEVKGAPWPLDAQPDYLQIADSQYRLGHSDPDRFLVVESDMESK